MGVAKSSSECSPHPPIALNNFHECPLCVADMQVLDGGSPLSQGKGFRSFATLNFAWGSLVKVLLAAPANCRAALDGSEGRLVQRRSKLEVCVPQLQSCPQVKQVNRLLWARDDCFHGCDSAWYGNCVVRSGHLEC